MVALAVAQVEVALDPRLVVVRTGEIAANRHTQRVAAVPRGAEGPPEAGVGAVGDDHVAGPDRFRRRRPVLRHRGPGEQAVLQDRGDGLRAVPDGGAGLDRALGDHLVELAAANDIAVGREVGMFGPGELERDAVGDRAQSVEALEPFEAFGETDVVQLAHGARSETVAAGLLARKALLLHGKHSTTALREPIRSRRTRRSRADDEDVVRVVRSACSRAHDHMLRRSRTKRRDHLPHNVSGPI